MKKIVFLLVLLLLPVMVYSEENNINISSFTDSTAVKTLIPVDTKVTVKTEKFDYNNLVYNSKVDSKGNSLITFESIKNNTVSKTPISINILLFDNNQKNIGYVTYCTDKDLSSNYSGYKLAGNNSVPFSINVVSKYFVTGRSAVDVKYIAVLDENKYCQIGGYEKYKDLTIDEIVNGVGNKDKESDITKFINSLKENGLVPIIIIVLVGIAVLVIIIMIISSVLKKVKNNRIIKNQEVKIDAPMEETIDLSYGEVSNDTETLDDDSSISMGEVSNNIPEENVIEEEKNKDEEDGSDLTKFFN